MRVLDRLRQDGGLAKLIEFPVIAERLSLERLQQDIDAFLEPLAAFGEVMTQALELIWLISPAEPHIQPAAGKYIGRCNLLRHNQRVMQRQHHNSRANPDALRLGGDVVGQHQRP